MGGGIDSMVWQSYEFVNQWDHGRNLQVGVTIGYGACYEPTECGSQDDGIENSTTSILQGIACGGNHLQSQSLPAFWLAPGEKPDNPTTDCTVAINTVKVSSYTLTKSVAILSSEHVEYNFTVYVPDLINQIQIEGPTEFSPVDFDAFYTVDSSGKVTPVDTSSGEVNYPLIFATTDGTHAVGVVGQTIPGWMLTYAKFYFSTAPCPSEAASKWSVVYRLFSTIQPGTRFGFTTHICVGTLSSVPACMLKFF